MKKIIIMLVLLSLKLFADISIKLIDFKGNIFINKQKVFKKGIKISGDDTLKVLNGGKALLLFNDLFKISVIDSSELILNELFLELKTGMIRVTIPDTVQENISIKTKDLVTSIIQNTSSYDFSIKKMQDSVVVAVYKGDSLKIFNYNQNIKNLSDFFYVPEFNKVVFVNDSINNIEEFDINKDFSSIEDKINFISNLYSKLDIQECKLHINNLLKNDELSLKYQKDLLFKLSYLYCFDNNFEKSKFYLQQLLTLDRKMVFNPDSISPKFYKIYEEVREKIVVSNDNFIKRYYCGIVPGMYQLKEKKYIKGFSLLGLNVLLLSGFFYEQNRQNYYRGLMNKTTNRELIFDYYDKSLMHYNRKKYFLFAEFLLYSFNIFDVYRISKNKIKFKVLKNEDKVLFSINYNF